MKRKEMLELREDALARTRRFRKYGQGAAAGLWQLLADVITRLLEARLIEAD